MANVDSEFDRAISIGRDIDAAENQIEAISHAYSGLSEILLAILFELREMREQKGGA